MNCMRTMIAAAILSASIASPVFGQDVGNLNNVGAASGSYVGRPPGGREARLQRFYRSYNQMGPAVVAPPMTSEANHNLQGFGFTGRDRSRVGGYDPNLNPSGS